MKLVDIKWLSGKHTKTEVVDSDQFLTSIFGSTRIPDDVTVTVTEIEDAAQEGKVEESNIGKHQDGDSSGEAPGSSDSDSFLEGGEIEETEEE